MSKVIPSAEEPAVNANAAKVADYLGQTVSDFCGRYGFVDDKVNHCAHFVSHVLKLRLAGAALCSNVPVPAKTPANAPRFSYEERREGFCVRVNEVFNNCANRSYWPDKDPIGTYLIVATIKANILKAEPLTIDTHERNTNGHRG